MIAAILRHSMLALFVPACILITATIPSPVAGQTPLVEKEDATAEVATRGHGKTDRDKLQGNWQITSLDLGFTVVKRDDKLPEWEDTFSKEVFFTGDRHGHVGHSNSRFKLDESRIPKQITLYSDDGKTTFRGIYTLEGDTLTVCMNGDGASVCRPEEFVAKKGQPVVITTYKKIVLTK
jgi:uncharacterized protein (TIGR03067 family)